MSTPHRGGRAVRSTALPVLLLLLAVCAPGARAEGNHDELESLRRAFDRYRAATERRLAELEARQTAGAKEEAAGEDAELEALRAAAEEEASGAPAASTAGPNASPAGGGWSSQWLNAFNPRITAFGDALAPIELTGAESDTDDRFSLREAELDFRAAVNPYASAVLIASLGEEAPGEYGASVEEGYITLDALPWGLRAKIGRFLPQVGNVNRLHTHDLPWPTRPYASQDLVGGDEGWKDNGLALSWLSPPLGPLAFTITGWALTGENAVGLSSGPSDRPTWMGRLEAHLDFNGRTMITLGGNLRFGYADTRARLESVLAAGDLLVQHKPDAWTSVVAFGELYSLEAETPTGRDHGFGAWCGLQLQPALGRLWSPLRDTYFGLRYDVSDYDEQTEGARQWALGAYASFYSSEFLRFRVGLEHRERDRSFGRPDEDRVYLQLTFVFGSHPVEPFWVNR
ncbi:MAG: hypothetical protein D6776_05395 [Planctomycetota bacterium]|nr:MAG: hypothetical protein D6776_05395 [Planctomycetota bacterium]